MRRPKIGWFTISKRALLDHVSTLPTGRYTFITGRHIALVIHRKGDR
jgi:hypothetical protein